MTIKKMIGGNFGFYLVCEKEECENRKWSIETEFTLKLVSLNGKSFMKNSKKTFEETEGHGWSEFIGWKELESDYVVDDSIVVEAHVKIIKITDSPCTETKNQRTFMLNHTINNVSSIGTFYTDTEIHFNVPWRLCVVRENGFLGVYIHCDKIQEDGKSWSIAVERVIRLKSLNGQSLHSKHTSTYDKPFGYGWDKLVRLDDMEKKYVVDDSIMIEVRAKILVMTECDEDAENRG